MPGSSDAGFWFYAAPGSGIYYDVGKTAVFADHAAAYASLLKQPAPANANNAVATFALAARAASRLPCHALGARSWECAHGHEGRRGRWPGPWGWHEGGVRPLTEVLALLGWAGRLRLAA